MRGGDLNLEFKMVYIIKIILDMIIIIIIMNIVKMITIMIILDMIMIMIIMMPWHIFITHSRML